MNQFAFVKDNGEIGYIMSTGSSSDYYHNVKYGDYTAVIVDSDINTHEFMLSKYWDGNAWQDREPKNSTYYVWENNTWVFQEELFLAELRGIRNKYLQDTDWTQMPDSPLNETERGWWASYRQQLRDLPQNVSDITSLDDVVWPIPPN